MGRFHTGGIEPENHQNKGLLHSLAGQPSSFARAKRYADMTRWLCA